MASASRGIPKSPRRNPPRRKHLYLSLLTGLLCAGSPLQALALSFSVNTVLDTADANPGDGLAQDSLGRTSLRAAIDEANALSGAHSIGFDSALLSSGDVGITLTLFDTGLDNGEYGKTAFIIRNGTSLTIAGPSGDDGISIERPAAAANFRIFHVQPTASLAISNLAIANGVAAGGNSGGNGTGGGGGAGLGGALFNEGSVTLDGVTLSANQAIGGNGGLGASNTNGGGGGGGVGANGGNGSNAGFGQPQPGGVGGGPNGGPSNGSATGAGGGGGGGNGRQGAGSQTANTGGAGGLFGGGGGGGSALGTGGGSGTVTGGTGGAGGFGGGAGGGGGVQSFNFTRVPGLGGAGGFGAGNGSPGGSNNNVQPPSGDGGGGAGLGGAVFNYGGTLSVRNSTLSGNTAQGGSSGFVPSPYGGGVGPGGDGGAGSGFGGAIFSMNRGATSASVNLRHVTIADSTVAAGQSLGAAGAATGALYVLGNSGTSTAVVNNSIIADTSAGVDFVASTISGGTANSSGVGNLIETNTGFGGSITSTADPNLAGLADNRGPTPTRALNTGSPAIDAGDPGQTGGLTTDQRGGIFQRVVDGDLNGSTIVDIGAYELIQIDYGDAPDFASGTGDVEVLLESGVDDQRISNVGTDGDASRGAGNGRVAFNATANEYLVVWSADNDANDNENEIWGRRFDGSTRQPIGGEFRISTTGTDGDADRDAFNPDVSWSSQTNEYLVVWQGDNESTDNEFETYGRFVGPTGALQGIQLRISQMGTDGDANSSASNPALAYSATSNEFLVVWQGDEGLAPLVDNEFEIFGQRISAASRNTAGSRMQISMMGGANGADANYDANSPDLAWNSAANTFLVVWGGDDNTGGLVDNEFEIWGRRVAGGGLPQGATQTRLSSMGGTGNTTYGAANPDVAYDPDDGQFLVVFQGDDDSVGDNETEIFGQRVNASSGATVGSMIRISEVGLPGSTQFAGFNPAVGYSTATGNYLVAFNGDEYVDNENEILARRVSGSGTVLDGNEIRLTHMGPDGSTAFGAFNADLAYDSVNGDALVVYQADDDSGALVDNESEIYGQVVTDTPLVDYQTRGADNGPAHIRVAGLKLGTSTDNDPDGQASLNADGDDLNGIDDEDATASIIEFNETAPAITVNVTNTTGAAATLYGWIDYNGNGVFDNASERGSVVVPNGSNGVNVVLNLPTPPASPAPLTVARFRLSADPLAANATGIVNGGEVEDTMAEFVDRIFADGFD
ncbi:MAG: hypothetical protein KF811_08145 [Dokdonella sp.]|nr:hypothetical protein [Dokdonella sp.]